MPNDNEQLKVVEEKTVDPKQLQQTVIDLPAAKERQSPRAAPIILTIAAQSQSITPWGWNPKRRDQELRAFWPTETWLASVVYSVSARNASFVWEIVGSDPAQPKPRNTANAVECMLKRSNFGKGWRNLMLKTCIDLYSADNGSFWEILRDSPDSPVVGINHLDSGNVTRTGDIENPAIYTDRYGREHLMPWWKIKSFEELPSPIENAFDMQYCAVSRCLLAAEIIQSIAVYKQEKVSGNFAKAVDFISGPTQQNIDDGLTLAKEQILNKGLLRYSLPIIIPGLDPSAAMSHIHIDLASLPDNFDEDASFRWYVAQLAVAFGVDYQEIAPLMAGSLGSGQQGEIMHLKTHGKGPALIMSMIEEAINDGLIPSNVKFRFLEQDLRSESEKADARFTRSKDRSMRVKSGELDGKAARQIAVADGDLPEWLAQEIDAREEKMQEEMPNQPTPSQQEQQRQEMTASQVEGGIETQETKVIQPSRLIGKLRRFISKKPDEIVDMMDEMDDEEDDEDEEDMD